jgi:hypothetical protein
MTFAAPALPSLRPVLAAAAIGVAGLPAPLAAETLGVKIGNDMSLCAPGRGPAVRLEVSGLKSASGYLFVRT